MNHPGSGVLPDRRDRFILTGIALGQICFAGFLTLDAGQLVTSELAEEWAPALFLTAGLTTLAWTFRLTSRRLYAAAGALAIVAYLSRAGQIVLTFIQDDVDRPWSLRTGMTAWLLMAALTALAWRRLEPPPPWSGPEGTNTDQAEVGWWPQT